MESDNKTTFLIQYHFSSLITKESYDKRGFRILPPDKPNKFVEVCLNKDGTELLLWELTFKELEDSYEFIMVSIKEIQ